MPKIIDAMIFYNELDMLEARLHILGDVVDHFVICEAAETHSGQPKPYHFAANAERFKQWTDQIVYVQVDNLTGSGRNSWQRERYHRSRIADGLVEAAPDDLIIVGDCDEIANPAVLGSIADGAMLELDFYYYSLRHRVRQGWAIGAMRWGLEKDPNKIRTGEGHDFPHIAHGGVHLSYFGGPQQVLSKIQSFMHSGDIAKDVPRDANWIKQRIDAGRDLYDRDLVIERVPLSDTLPRYILDHLDHYKALGWLE